MRAPLAFLIAMNLLGACTVEAASPSASDAAFEQYLSGLGYQDAGQWPDALVCFTRAIELDPKYADAYYARGIGRARAGDLPGAQADLTQTILLQPALSKAYLNRGRTFLQQGMPDIAEADFTKAMEAGPSADAFLERGSARWRRYDRDGAVADFSSAITLNPYVGEAYGRRGRALLAMDRLDEAAADFTTQIGLHEDVAEAYVGLGQVCERQVRMTEAAEYYTAALQLAPSAQAYLLRGGVFEQLDDPPRALADYTDVIRLEADGPAAAEAYRHRAYLRWQAGHREQAVSDCTAALMLEPGDALTRYNRGVYRFSVGDLPGAQEDWEAALARDPSLASRITPLLDQLRLRLAPPAPAERAP